MVEKRDPFTEAIGAAQQPKRAPVKAAYAEAAKRLKLTPASRLDAQGRKERREISNQLLLAVRAFENGYAEQIFATKQGIDKLWESKRKLKAAEITAVIAAIAAVAFAWYASVLLVLAVVLTRLLATRKLVVRAEQIAQESWGPTERATAIIGRLDSPQGAGTGLCDRADRFYLNNLDESELIKEFSRREAARQQQRHQQRQDEHTARITLDATSRQSTALQKSPAGQFQGPRVREA